MRFPGQGRAEVCRPVRFSSALDRNRGWIAASFLGLTLLTSSVAPTTRGGDQPADAPPARIASARSTETSTVDRSSPANALKPIANNAAAHEPTASDVGSTELHPTAKAKLAIAACKTKYASVKDYTCLFLKRERIRGVLTTQHEMYMKTRSQPLSIYMKFRRPNKGREAIYVTGKNNGKIKAHDVGLGKVLAGTMDLDPKGSMAMEDNLHPINEAGIGSLIDTVAFHWNNELTPGETEIRFRDDIRIGHSLCGMIESTHPLKHPSYQFYRVRLYIDREHGLPIRFEAYDWPKVKGGEGELVKDYTYLDLKVNVGLTELDFDTRNKAYSFGRF